MDLNKLLKSKCIKCIYRQTDNFGADYCTNHDNIHILNSDHDEYFSQLEEAKIKCSEYQTRKKNEEKCPKCDHEIGMWTYSKNNVWKISICSQCDTRINHFYYHKHIYGTIVVKIERLYRKIEKSIRMKKGLCCEPGCKNEPDTYEYPKYLLEKDERPEKVLLCSKHAKSWGFCVGCGDFYGGLEEFDFNNSSQFCSNCIDEFNHDCGFDDYDDFEECSQEFWDEYHSEPDYDREPAIESEIQEME